MMDFAVKAANHFSLKILFLFCFPFCVNIYRLLKYKGTNKKFGCLTFTNLKIKLENKNLALCTIVMFKCIKHSFNQLKTNSLMSFIFSVLIFPLTHFVSEDFNLHRNFNSTNQMKAMSLHRKHCTTKYGID